MNKLDKNYTDLLQDILDNGVEKKDRTGTGTISVFGRQIRHNMKDGFPLLTTKKMPFKTIVTELLWFLRGDTNIKYLVDNNCHIWDGDAYKNYFSTYKKDLGNGTFESNGGDSFYEPDESTTYGKIRPFTQEEFINKIKTDDKFAERWGELGPIYGAGWRRWNSITKKWWDDPEYQGYGADTRSGWEYGETQIDQIQNLINDLKTNPDSRRLMVNAWNVGELAQMILPPCHYGFQVYTRELKYHERRAYRAKLVREGKIPFGGEPIGDDFEDLDKHNIPTRAISLMWNQRSVDTFLGLPFNIASYGLLLEIIAKEVNMVPDELIGNLGDVHLYSNHIEQAKEQIGRDLSYSERWNILKERNGSSLGLDHDRIEQEVNESTPVRTREPFPLPTIKVTDSWKFLSSSPCFADTIQHKDIELIDYQSHPIIKAPLSN